MRDESTRSITAQHTGHRAQHKAFLYPPLHRHREDTLIDMANKTSSELLLLNDAIS